jgi:hypothetical protein
MASANHTQEFARKPRVQHGLSIALVTCRTLALRDAHALRDGRDALQKSCADAGTALGFCFWRKAAHQARAHGCDTAIIAQWVVS